MTESNPGVSKERDPSHPSARARARSTREGSEENLLSGTIGQTMGIKAGRNRQRVAEEGVPQRF